MRLNEDGTEAELTVDVGGAPAWFADADGHLWVTDPTNGLVTELDPVTGKVIVQVAVPGSPLDAVGAFGDAWVPVGSTGLLWRIGSGGEVRGAVQLEGGIYVAEQVGDEIWVENFSGTEIYRVDPSRVGE